MNTNTRLTIPMDPKLRTDLRKRADELGFDSPQALLRYVSKAIVDYRDVTFGEDEWGTPPAHTVARWQKELEEHDANKKAGKVKHYTDVDEMMTDLLADETN